MRVSRAPQAARSKVPPASPAARRACSSSLLHPLLPPPASASSRRDLLPLLSPREAGHRAAPVRSRLCARMGAHAALLPRPPRVAGYRAALVLSPSPVVGVGAAVGVAFANLAFWLGVGVVAGNVEGVGLAFWLRRHE